MIWNMTIRRPIQTQGFRRTAGMKVSSQTSKSGAGTVLRNRTDPREESHAQMEHWKYAEKLTQPLASSIELERLDRKEERVSHNSIWGSYTMSLGLKGRRKEGRRGLY